MIRVQALRKSFKEKGGSEYEAIREITVTFPDHGLVSVLGPSGCGKTTFLNLLSLLDVPSEGDIYFYDLNISQFKESQKEHFRHYSIGFVYQEYNLVEHLNVFDNVKLAFNIGSSVNQSEENEIVENVLEELNIAHLRKRFPNTLSGGEKQRVAIARALVNNPQILLADEPTGALDAKTSLDVMNVLKDLSKDRLVLMVTHNDKLAHTYSDRIVEMADGVIVNDSNPTQEAVEGVAETPRMQKRPWSVFPLAFKRLIHRKSRYAFLVAINTLAILSASIACGALLGSNRFSKTMERNALRAYPITISSVSIGMGDSFLAPETELFPDDGSIHRIDNDSTSIGVNSITTDYVNYLKTEFEANKVSPDSLVLRKGLSPTILMRGYSGEVRAFEAGDVSTFTGFDSLIKDSGNYFRPLYGGVNSIKDSFDVVYGHLPTQPNELVCVIDKYNSFPNHMLEELGYSSNKIKFKDFVNDTKFKFVDYNVLYGEGIEGDTVTAKWIKSNEQLAAEGKQADELQGLFLDALTYYNEGGEYYDRMLEKLNTAETYFQSEATSRTLKYFNRTSRSYYSMFMDEACGKEMTISCVIRPKKDQLFPYLTFGIYYSPEYSDMFLEANHNSYLAQEFERHLSFNRNPVVPRTPDAYNIFKNTDKYVKNDPEPEGFETDIAGVYEHIMNRKVYGVDDSIYQIEIMPRDFAEKAKIIKILDAWNATHTGIDYVTYIDVGGALINMVDRFTGVILVVLVLIILVVILFSVLVTCLLAILEVKGRTREIGLYRSLGSTRGYVRSLFITEQGMLGLFSGTLGMILAFCLIPVINKFIEKSVTVALISNFAYLTWWVALLIPIVAIAIAIISAIVPVILSSNKRPSDALREL